MKNKQKGLRYYRSIFSKDSTINNNWKKIKDDLTDEVVAINTKGENIQLNKYKIIDLNYFSSIDESYLEDLTLEYINSTTGNTAFNCMKIKIPSVIFWKYEDEFVIPNQINIEEFKEKPSICKPLQNMFIIAGYPNIKEEIVRCLSLSGRNPIDNFLGNVSKKATNYFRSVWKEYKTVEFNLRTNGDYIIPSVKEKNCFDFKQRSDGFKKFVSFLLLISVNVKANLMSNTLILTDEPENGLHPTGARYLRDELINISTKNYVVYSTHSIFMIDKEKVKRNLIVKKDKEITKTKEVISSRIADEEVLYNALNYSIFDTLKKENIIFEGWKDKKLFEVGVVNLKSTERKKFSSFGICHGQGVSNIKNITPLLKLANKNCIIVSDSDDMAIRYKKDFEDNKYFGKWFKYDDIDPKVEAITGEDFLKNSYIEKEFQTLQSKNLILSKQPFLSLKKDKNKLVEIKFWITKNGISPDEADKIIKELKDNLFSKLVLNNIEDKYFDFLSVFSQKI